MKEVTRLFDRKPFEAPPPVVAPAFPAFPAMPTAYGFAGATRCNVNERRFMATAELAGHLGLAHHSQRIIVDKLRALHRQLGLPLPRNPRIVRGHVKHGADAIHWRSLWDRGEALAWLDHGMNPPPALAPIPQSRQDHIRGVLGERAAAMLPARRVAGA